MRLRPPVVPPSDPIQNEPREPWMPDAESLLEKQARLLPPFQWQIIPHGGSSRAFYRVWGNHGESRILMRYDEKVEENLLYTAIARHLRNLGVQVPEIHFHETEKHLIAMEDLGDVSLFGFVQAVSEPSAILHQYESTLGQAAILHRQNHSPVPLMPGFDEKLYQWERRYFMENFVGRHLNLQLDSSTLEKIDREGNHLIDQLMKIPRCLIHRDFQSQNLILRNNSVWLIDFQGMRLGHAAYDVASLLFDPYVQILPDIRTSLITHHSTLLDQKPSEFSREVHLAGIQRLMQALGAYGFLGLVRNKTAFLKHIPRGFQNLRATLSPTGECPTLLKLLDQILSETPHLVT